MRNIAVYRSKTGVITWIYLEVATRSNLQILIIGVCTRSAPIVNYNKFSKRMIIVQFVTSFWIVKLRLEFQRYFAEILTALWLYSVL
jgi:hypothetical protein